MRGKGFSQVSTVVCLATILVFIQGCASPIQDDYQAVETSFLLNNSKVYHQESVSVTGHLAREQEHLGFGSSPEKAQNKEIWVDVKNAGEIPERFWAKLQPGETRKVTIYGTFHSSQSSDRGGYGQDGQYDNQIQVDRLVFRTK